MCNIEKKLSEFYKKKSSKDGLRSECKECNKIYSKKYKIDYYQKNKDRIKREICEDKEFIALYLKEYKKNNKEKLNLWRVNYRKNKFKKDPIYKLSHNLRSLISKSIKNFGYVKSKKTEFILGCSFEEFKIYLESQFKDGMTWENRSEWHLDHKIPISWAKSEEMVYKLNHYTNFQPLWAKDNISKGNKYAD